MLHRARRARHHRRGAARPARQGRQHPAARSPIPRSQARNRLGLRAASSRSRSRSRPGARSPATPTSCSPAFRRARATARPMDAIIDAAIFDTLDNLGRGKRRDPDAAANVGRARRARRGRRRLGQEADGPRARRRGLTRGGDAFPIPDPDGGRDLLHHVVDRAVRRAALRRPIAARRRRRRARPRAGRARRRRLLLKKALWTTARVRRSIRRP